MFLTLGDLLTVEVEIDCGKHDTIFYKEHSYWISWKCGSNLETPGFDAEHSQNQAVLAANKSRFELYTTKWDIKLSKSLDWQW